MSKVRHFALPIFSFIHPKNPDKPAIKVALVNRKRFMPAKLAQFEGTVALFGGAAQPDEERAAVLDRELEEELKWDYAVPEDAEVVDGAGFTVTVWSAGVLTQELYQELAGSCAEGVVDFVSLPSALRENYVDAVIREVILPRLA